MRTVLTQKRMLAFAAGLTLMVATASVAYAALPPADVAPANVPHGTLAGGSVNVLSVDAFTRAINQAHGTNAVLQHNSFTPGQSTLWHTHPGPHLVLVVTGEITLTDNHCNVTTYSQGQGFATGLDTHIAVAGPDGADFYSLYLLPAHASDLRTPPAGQSASPPNCAS
jgi:quercetin dioxygenase-like cupin family protein